MASQRQNAYLSNLFSETSVTGTLSVTIVAVESLLIIIHVISTCIPCDYVLSYNAVSDVDVLLSILSNAASSV